MSVLRPLHDCVIIRRTEPDKISAGGLILPDFGGRTNFGEVVAVGPGRPLDNGQLVEMELRAGDQVVFPEHSGTEFKLDGQVYLTMTQDHVIGVLDS